MRNAIFAALAVLSIALSTLGLAASANAAFVYSGQGQGQVWEAEPNG